MIFKKSCLYALLAVSGVGLIKNCFAGDIPDYDPEITTIVDKRQTANTINLVVRGNLPLEICSNGNRCFATEKFFSAVTNAMTKQGLAEYTSLIASDKVHLIVIDLMGTDDSWEPELVKEEWASVTGVIPNSEILKAIANHVDFDHDMQWPITSMQPKNQFVPWPIRWNQSDVTESSVINNLKGDDLKSFKLNQLKELVSHIADQVNQEYQDKDGKVIPTLIYFHCSHGLDRTGAVAVSYLNSVFYQAANEPQAEFKGPKNDIFHFAYKYGASIFEDGKKVLHAPDQNEINNAGWYCIDNGQGSTCTTNNLDAKQDAPEDNPWEQYRFNNGDKKIFHWISTHYWFLKEADFPNIGQVTLKDENLKPLLDKQGNPIVVRGDVKTCTGNDDKDKNNFYCRLVKEGSGVTAKGDVVNLAADFKKDYSKAKFEVLDANKFPYGKGSKDNPIYPLRSVAINDPAIPFGTIIYLPAFDGLMVNGVKLDGYFSVDDDSWSFENQHIDIFDGFHDNYDILIPQLKARGVEDDKTKIEIDVCGTSAECLSHIKPYNFNPTQGTGNLAISALPDKPDGVTAEIIDATLTDANQNIQPLQLAWGKTFNLSKLKVGSYTINAKPISTGGDDVTTYTLLFQQAKNSDGYNFLLTKDQTTNLQPTLSASIASLVHLNVQGLPQASNDIQQTLTFKEGDRIVQQFKISNGTSQALHLPDGHTYGITASTPSGYQVSVSPTSIVMQQKKYPTIVVNYQAAQKQQCSVNFGLDKVVMANKDHVFGVVTASINASGFSLPLQLNIKTHHYDQVMAPQGWNGQLAEDGYSIQGVIQNPAKISFQGEIYNHQKSGGDLLKGNISWFMPNISNNDDVSINGTTCKVTLPNDQYSQCMVNFKQPQTWQDNGKSYANIHFMVDAKTPDPNLNISWINNDYLSLAQNENWTASFKNHTLNGVAAAAGNHFKGDYSVTVATNNPNNVIPNNVIINGQDCVVQHQ